MKSVSGFDIFAVLCSVLLPLLVSTQACADTENTWPVQILRLGESHQFFHTMTNNNGYKKFLRKKSSIEFTEPQDYNLGKNPVFDWTPSIFASGFIVAPYANDVEVITAKSDYFIQARPSFRKDDNLVIKYILEYYADTNGNGKLDLVEKISPLTDIAIQPYAISWCGDGIKDTPRSDERWIAESCDIADGVPTGKHCTTSCTLEDKSH